MWQYYPGMRIRIRIRSDPVIFGQPDPVLFSTDPDPDPTCNNGVIKLFLSWTKYKSESTNSIIKWWVIISNFVPTYLKYKNIFFFISISGRIRSRIRFRIRIRGKKFRILIPAFNTDIYIYIFDEYIFPGTLRSHLMRKMLPLALFNGKIPNSLQYSKFIHIKYFFSRFFFFNLSVLFPPIGHSPFPREGNIISLSHLIIWKSTMVM